MQPRSFSTDMERFKPNVPAKAKVVHNTPDVTDSRTLISNSRAKLKITITSREKTSIAEISSRERNSEEKSLCTIANTALRKDGAAFFIRQLPVYRRPANLCVQYPDGLRRRRSRRVRGCQNGWPGLRHGPDHARS